jgi:hypothetical protein
MKRLSSFATCRSGQSRSAAVAAPAVPPRHAAHSGAPALAADALRTGMRTLLQTHSHSAVQARAILEWKKGLLKCINSLKRISV